jgi:preprotein translocase SecE subunit
VTTEALERPEQSALRRAWTFLTVEVPAEVRKVTWPSWTELKKATGVIVVFVAVLGFVIGLMDTLLQFVLVTGVAKLF